MIEYLIGAMVIMYLLGGMLTVKLMDFVYDLRIDNTPGVIFGFAFWPIVAFFLLPAECDTEQ